MTQLDALIALKEAVESGKWENRAVVLVCFPEVPQVAMNAYNGSLDAARALHAAVLPGFSPSVGQNIWHKYWMATVTVTNGGDIGDTYAGTHNTNPARAWLLAILAALIEKERNA